VYGRPGIGPPPV